MSHEIETKILNVSVNDITEKMQKLGAEQIEETRLFVDWYGPKGLTHNGDDPWFMRIRTYSGGQVEVTWKGKSDVLENSRKHKEINFNIESAELLGELFEELGLEKYAHQEKDRISWIYNNWRFDLDQYPGMAPYLEIEASEDSSIKEAIETLGLQNFKTSSEGERNLIQSEYHLDWFNMRF